MKRYLKLAITIAWLTEPVSTLVILRCGAANTGSYPFYGVCSWLYEFLYRSTDTTFVLVVLGAFVFWTAMYAVSLLVSRYYSLKFVLCFIALVDLVAVSLRDVNSLTALWDMLYVCSVMIVGKRKMPAQSISPSLLGLRIGAPESGRE